MCRKQRSWLIIGISSHLSWRGWSWLIIGRGSLILDEFSGGMLGTPNPNVQAYYLVGSLILDQKTCDFYHNFQEFSKSIKWPHFMDVLLLRQSEIDWRQFLTVLDSARFAPAGAFGAARPRSGRHLRRVSHQGWPRIFLSLTLEHYRKSYSLNKSAAHCLHADFKCNQVFSKKAILIKY